MVAGAAVMDIAERALHGVGAGTIGRQQEPRHPRVGGQPLLHRFGLMDLIVIHDDVEPCIAVRRIAGIELGEQVAEQRVGFAWPQAMVQRPRGQSQGASEVVLLVLARRHDLQLAPLRPPGIPHVGPHMDSEFIRAHQRLAQPPRFVDKADPGQAVHPLGGVVCGHQLGPFPHPAHLVPPAAPRLGRDGDPALSLQGRRQCGTAPAGAAPALGPGRRLEQGHQRPAQRRDPHGRADGWAELAVVVGLQAQGAGAIRPHRAVDTGARAEQDGRDVRRVASRGTQQHHVEGQQVALARAPQRGQHLGLLLLPNLDDSMLGHGGVSSLIRGCLAMSDVS
jgi:hypothetical protein